MEMEIFAECTFYGYLIVEILQRNKMFEIEMEIFAECTFVGKLF